MLDMYIIEEIERSRKEKYTPQQIPLEAPQLPDYIEEIIPKPEENPRGVIHINI